MAIKLLGVPGPKLADDEKETQDFLLINSPVFFVRNAADYVELSKANAEEAVLLLHGPQSLSLAAS